MLRILLPTLLVSLPFLGGPFQEAPQEEANEQVALGPSDTGKLVIVGGGGTTETIQRAALLLVGKEKPRVLVLPQASGAEDRGQPSVEMWKQAGAGTVINMVDLTDRRKAVRELDLADFIWFPGGSQRRLVQALQEAELIEKLRERFQAGAVVGGTSAGAAAMGDVLIEGAPEPAAMLSGAMKLHEGLGILPGVIVDQHFTARNRQARLLTAVLDLPQHVGLGLDEKTAAVIEGKKLVAVGEGNVFLYDARGSRRQNASSGERQGALDLRMHVLRQGMEWSW